MEEYDVFAGEEEKIETYKRELAISRNRRENGLNQLLDSAEVREWLWNILLLCGMYQSVQGLDPGTMGYRSGRKDIGFLILDEILNANPEAYRKMKEENSIG